MYTANLIFFWINSKSHIVLYLQKITQKYSIKIFVYPRLFVIWECSVYSNKNSNCKRKNMYITDGINVNSFIKIEKNRKITNLFLL